MNSRHEKYFLGEMSEEERAYLEQELEQNPELRAKFEEDRELFDALKNQMLRRKIRSVLAEQERPTSGSSTKKKRWGIWIGLAGLLLLLWGIWLNIPGDPEIESASPSVPGQQLQEKSNIPAAGQLVPSVEKKSLPGKWEEKQRPPIALAPIEAHSLRGLRGIDSIGTPWGELVNRIWYAPVPPVEKFGERFKPAIEALSGNNYEDAFLLLPQAERQAPANDTLEFLKGLCLMELGEGKEALRSFEQLSDKPYFWAADVEWNIGLCHLLTGEKGKSITVFKKIATQPKHRYYENAVSALKLLN